MPLYLCWQTQTCLSGLTDLHVDALVKSNNCPVTETVFALKSIFLGSKWSWSWSWSWSWDKYLLFSVSKFDSSFVQEVVLSPIHHWHSSIALKQWRNKSMYHSGPKGLATHLLHKIMPKFGIKTRTIVVWPVYKPQAIPSQHFCVI